MGCRGSAVVVPELDVPTEVLACGSWPGLGAVSSGLDLGQEPHAEKRLSRCGTALDGVGYACRKGHHVPQECPNQDSWVALRAPGRLGAYAVFDGHGDRGHTVSHLAMQLLVGEVLHDGHCSADRAPEAIKLAFQHCHKTILADRRLRESGTTATVVLHDELAQRLVLAHVGDSTAVLLKRSKKGGTTRLEAIPLTVDHKPDLARERVRIEGAGGRVIFDGVHHRVVRAGKRSPSLAMSRSLGDAPSHQHCGVISAPDVADRAVGPQDCAVLICSDGVWEVLRPQEAADLVADLAAQGAFMAAAKRLAEAARACWLQRASARGIDDITVLLASLRPVPWAAEPGSPSPSALSSAPSPRPGGGAEVGGGGGGGGGTEAGGGGGGAEAHMPIGAPLVRADSSSSTRSASSLSSAASSSVTLRG